jgi:hypothetical protein
MPMGSREHWHSETDPRLIKNRGEFVTGKAKDYLTALHQELPPEEMKVLFPQERMARQYKQKIIDNVLDFYGLGEGELPNDEILGMAVELGIKQGFLEKKETEADSQQTGY